jgi:hypothetical protein
VLCSKLIDESGDKDKSDSDFSHFSFLRITFFCALAFILLLLKTFQDISIFFCHNGSFGIYLGICSLVLAQSSIMP